MTNILFRRSKFVIGALVAAICCTAVGCGGSATPAPKPAADAGWPTWGGDRGGTRYSALDQINRTNVRQLKIAWTFHTGETASEDFASWPHHTFEATPLMAHGSLFVSTAYGRVFALDPASGAQKWKFDARLPKAPNYGHAIASRGVTLWEDNARADAPCAITIFLGTIDGRLIALDAMSGERCQSFAKGGEVNLAEDIGLSGPGNYGVTSPPVTYRNLVIVGSSVADLHGERAELGVVRAFDARSGALAWSWDPIPRQPDDPAWSSWENGSAMLAGAANAWAPLSVDADLDLVFIPTSTPGSSFFGGYRPGNNEYASSLVALRASTGEVVWHRQLVHHDVWDYDTPAQPVLVNLTKDGRRIPLVVQATKMGMLFVFHRDTGEPYFPIEERRVPQDGAVRGERLSPTQPFPLRPAPLVSHAPVEANDAWGFTFWDRNKCREQIKRLRSEGIYTPPSVEGTFMTPGYGGGMNWGSGSFDPVSQRFFVNVMQLPMFSRLIPNERVDALVAAGDVDKEMLIPQHGIPYTVTTGFVLSPWGVPCTAPPWGEFAAVDLVSGDIAWRTPLGTVEDLAPAIVPNFRYGVPNLGGSIVTAGGLVFIAAAFDDYLRAFDSESGKELWKGRLPAGGQATPMTFAVAGRQMVVIAAGGHGSLGTKQGDALVAFALPVTQ